MIRCEDCIFYKPQDEWTGYCTIQLPPWTKEERESIELTERAVAHHDGCDLGWDKDS